MSTRPTPFFPPIAFSFFSNETGSRTFPFTFFGNPFTKSIVTVDEQLVFEYILSAVHLLADGGWRLLPQYHFEPATAQWRHQGGRAEPPMRLDDVSYRHGEMEYRSCQATEPESALGGYLEEAKRILAAAGKGEDLSSVEREELSPDFEHLRWFPLPGEILHELEGQT